jgi:hypothetical protein
MRVGPAGVEPTSNRVSDGCLAARPRPESSALYGTRTRLACSTGRSPHPLRHRACKAPGGSRTRLSTLARWCLDRSATGATGPREARTEGVEPSACGLEPHCSPGSTSLAVSCPGRDRTYDLPVNSGSLLPTELRGKTSSGGWVRASGLPGFSGTLLPSELHRSSGWPVGVEPTRLRFTAGSRCRFGFGHSIPGRSRTCMNLRLRRAACLRHTPGIIVSTPARNRTWTCSFGTSHDVRFTTRAAVDRGGS